MSLHLYKPLGDANKATRLEAASLLSAELLKLLDGDRSEKTKSSVDYALGRLTKGLASGRESARLGFAVALTEFLIHLQSAGNADKWDLPLERVISVLKTNTQVPGHSTGQEERDYYLGRLFGLKTLIQSGVLFKASASAQYDEVLSLLFELSKKKPWLREACAWALCSSVQGWSDEVRPWAAKATYDALVESGLVKSSEGTALWLTLQVYCPGATPPKKPWTKGSPLHLSSLASLAKVLKEVDSKDGEPGGVSLQKGSWNPKLHFVWDLILSAYFGDEGPWPKLREEKGLGMAAWGEFWEVVVDESLFSASSSEERKFWGFLVFNKALERLTSLHEAKQDLASIFSKNFMRCLINQLSDSERYLNMAAQKCIRSLLQRSEACPWAVPVIAKQLIPNNGTPDFDSLTKTKTVEKITILADEEGLSEIIGDLKMILVDPLGSKGREGAEDSREQQVKAAEVRRQWAANQMLSLIRKGKSAKAASWIGGVVTILAGFGHLESPIDGIELGSAVSVANQEMFRLRLLSCLTHLTSIKDIEFGDKTWPYLAVKSIFQSKNSPPRRLVMELDDTIESAIRSAQETLGKINKKRSVAIKAEKNKEAAQLGSFELLYSLVILQILNGETDALEVLEELKLCYDRVFGKKKHSKGDVGVSEVLLEILLSFLSKPSALLRKIAHQVFSAFVDGITEEGLALMTKVLETKENLGGQQELFDNNEDGDASGDSEGEDEELGSGVEALDVEEMDIDSPESDGGGAPLTLESEDEDSKLEAALFEALGPHKPTTNSDSGSDVDDETMLALDESLVKIFKQHSAARSKKKDSKNAKETIINFKSRVLDLLEIFAKSPSALQYDPSLVILPLLRCIRSTSSKSVASNAANVVRLYSRNQPPAEPDTNREDLLWRLLQSIHEEAALDGGVGRGKHKISCSASSLIVLKMLVGRDVNADAVGRVVGVYANTLTRWLTDRKCRVHSGLFTDFLNWAGSVNKRIQQDGSAGR